MKYKILFSPGALTSEVIHEIDEFVFTNRYVAMWDIRYPICLFMNCEQEVLMIQLKYSEYIHSIILQKIEQEGIMDNISMETLMNNYTAKALAKMVWDTFPGETYNTKLEEFMKFNDELRSIKSLAKPVKVRNYRITSNEEIIAKSIHRSFSDLSKVTVDIAPGVPLAIPRLFLLADMPTDHPLKQSAINFIKDHNLAIHRVRRPSARSGRSFTQNYLGLNR